MAQKRPESRSPTRKPKADLLLRDYEAFFGELKERIKSAQLRAAIAVDRELVLSEWQFCRANDLAAGLTTGRPSGRPRIRPVGTATVRDADKSNG
jgi:hypothetical protein